MWYEQSIFYQIYPLGFCGAPAENDGITADRISTISGWIPHLKSLGVNAVYFGPVFESDRHGYDTRDYETIDCRLGTNAGFKGLCEELRSEGIRIVLDGVFNHVGRGFHGFKDVLLNRRDSAYADWFNVNFDGNSAYNDGLWYEGWEGHYDLVKLNLKNPDVVDYLLSCVDGWIEEFGIDGLRLDVAYMLDRDFLRALRRRVKSYREDFFLLGEMIHGDYNQLLTGDMGDSVTNYENYKSLYSSFNDKNMHEIGYSLNRQFGPDHWTLYKGKPLFTFVDNHDVSRIASALKEGRHLPAVFGMLMTMPGIPCIYYGSEWGATGSKSDGDGALRQAYAAPIQNELTELIKKYARIRLENPGLCLCGYRQLAVSGEQLVFERDNIYVAVNISDSDREIDVNLPPRDATELVSGAKTVFGGRMALPPGISVYK